MPMPFSLPISPFLHAMNIRRDVAWHSLDVLRAFHNGLSPGTFPQSKRTWTLAVMEKLTGGIYLMKTLVKQNSFYSARNLLLLLLGIGIDKISTHFLNINHSGKVRLAELWNNFFLAHDRPLLDISFKMALITLLRFVKNVFVLCSSVNLYFNDSSRSLNWTKTT